MSGLDDFYIEDGDENLNYNPNASANANADKFYEDDDDDDTGAQLEFQDFDHTQKPQEYSGLGTRNARKTGGYGSLSYEDIDEEDLDYDMAPPPPEEQKNEFGAPLGSDDTINLEGDYTPVDFGGNNGKNAMANAGVESFDKGSGADDIEPTAKFWTVQFYRPLFNVDTTNVLRRILLSFYFYPSFFERVGDNPDLYGPFWISATLIFLIAATGNFATYLSYAIADRADEWTYDFHKVTFAALLIYAYLLIIPLCLWAVFKYLEIQLSMLHHVCIYGYSLFPYAIASFVLIIPLEWVRWVLMVIACLIVSGVLVRNYFGAVKATGNRAIFVPGIIAISIMLLANALLALAFRLYFFEYVDSKLSSSSSANSASNSNSVSA